MELTTTIQPSAYTGHALTLTPETSQPVCDSILEHITSSGILDEIDTDSLGIYTVSPNAGTFASVAFWRRALDEGPGFMSPQHFPWTLANAPAAYLARKLGAHGPNVTFVGETSSAAFLHAHMDIRAGRCRRGLVLLVRFGENAEDEAEYALHLV